MLETDDREPGVTGDRPDAGALRVAAIDLGTNSVRLIVAGVDGPDSYTVLHEEREQTRLGHRLHETGRIDPETGEKTLEALERMKAVAESFGVAELRAVGTAALRAASNGPEFVESARERFGLALEVIDAEEEAELALRSVRRNFPLGGDGAAVVDIGGGSMEVVLTTAGGVDEVHSLPLGAVVLTERYVGSDPIDDADWRRLGAAIDRELARQIGKPPFPTPVLVGSGGTFTAVGSLAMQDREGETGPVQGYSMTRDEFERQLRRLREMPLETRRRLPGLDPERADIIVAGAAAVVRLVRRLDVSRILINDRGIRDGLLLEMISRLGAGRGPVDRSARHRD